MTPIAAISCAQVLIASRLTSFVYQMTGRVRKPKAAWHALRPPLMGRWADSSQAIKIFRSEEGVITLRPFQGLIAEVHHQMSQRPADPHAFLLRQLLLVGKLEPAHRAIDDPWIPQILDQ